MSSGDGGEGWFSGFAKVSEFVSLFSFLEPSFADTGEGFKELGVCNGLLSGRCIDVVVGRFLTVGGVLARELSLICKFEGKFNDIQKCSQMISMGLVEKLGSFFYQKCRLFRFLVLQGMLLRQVSCLGEDFQIDV